MVLWLIGMSGAGKTVIGLDIYKKLKSKYSNLIFIDGDLFRKIMGDDLGHALEERKKNADRMCRFCEYMESQEINVICGILSIFHDSQEWNRKNLKNYHEVYIKVSFDELKKRDSKGLYNKALKGEIKNVVGVDVKFPEPIKPDFIIENEGNKSIGEIADIIINNIPSGKFIFKRS